MSSTEPNIVWVFDSYILSCLKRPPREDLALFLIHGHIPRRISNILPGFELIHSPPVNVVLCGHIARLRRPGEWPSCNVNKQSENDDADWFERRSSGSGPFAAVHWRKWQHHGQTIVATKSLAFLFGWSQPDFLGMVRTQIVLLNRHSYPSERVHNFCKNPTAILTLSLPSSKTTFSQPS